MIRCTPMAYAIHHSFVSCVNYKLIADCPTLISYYINIFKGRSLILRNLAASTRFDCIIMFVKDSYYCYAQYPILHYNCWVYSNRTSIRIRIYTELPTLVHDAILGITTQVFNFTFVIL